MRPSIIPAAVVAGVVLAAAAGATWAQQPFPSKPIRVVVSTTAGSQPDMLLRMFGQKMSEAWGQPLVVDNRPGAQGTLAGTPVSKAAPDGHTLLYALPNFAISAALQTGLPYDPLKDFVGISQIGFTTNVIVVAPALGVKSVAEFVAAAKGQPGKFIFGTSPTGSAAHLSGARFNVVAGIKSVHVAFKGGPEATIEVLAGRIHYHIGTLGVLLPFIKDGRLIALAVTSPARTPALPDVPALGETLAEFSRPETSHGLLAPAGTPRAILNRINKEIVRVLGLPDIRERTQGIGYVVASSTPEEYSRILRAQIQTLTKLVQDAGLRPK
jgi:tripartite-type tricarboxylate transporter receptor subunit TctC